MKTVDIYLSIMATLAVPWAAWISLTLWRLDRDAAATDARQDGQLHDHEERLNELERMFPRRIPHT